jgi:hypothetical protein
MSRVDEPNFAIGWFLRNWPMAIIVSAGLVIATVSIRAGNWILAVPVSAIAIGVALNIVAMIANRGKMPADTDGAPIDEPNHDAMQDQTRIRILGDWIPIAGWLHSPGDIVLYSGLIGVFICRLLQ